MVAFRMLDRPGFEVIGRKTWISGQDNELFGRFWGQCRDEGLFETFERIRSYRSGPQTGASILGISCVEKNPADRAFYYMIAVEAPPGLSLDELEHYRVPACQWAVFECRGDVPGSIMEAEIYAFTEWLPASGFTHAAAPEMEVYLPDVQNYCEFWLPVVQED